MTETKNSPTNPVANTDEPLRLKCPQCGGGLNLKRRYLGIRGQCVHCQTPLTAVEEEGAVKVVCHATAPSFDRPVAPETVSHAPVPSLAAPVEVQPTTAPATPEEAPAAEAIPASEPISRLPWELPDFDSSGPAEVIPREEPPSLREEAPPVSFLSSFPESKTPSIEPLLPGRDENNLFSGKIDLPPSKTLSPGSEEPSSPFGMTADSPSPFLNEPPSPGIQAAWGTQVPNGNHASISPFSTGSAQGGGFGDSLFREKAVKESSLKSTEESSPFGASPFAASPFSSTPFATPASASMPTATARQEADAAAGELEEDDPSKPKRDCQEFVILDGDGRPIRPMSKEEEESFATNFFKYENARTKPTWLMRLRKKIIRMLIFFCVIGAIGAGASFFIPKETLLVWKDKAIKWLEPGMAIFDYLPEKLRPDWLPQTDFGIDAGTDENGQPKKKLNAFEGLDKLKGDVGNMRGAADKQLEELKNF